MTTATVDIGTIITSSPDIRDGRPRIAGTGVTVQQVVGYYRLGLNPEEIALQIDYLSYVQVCAAIAYYHANREEVETAIARDQASGSSAEAEWHRAHQSDE
jgi:uncharacterized protein (DUF433 family)